MSFVWNDLLNARRFREKSSEKRNSTDCRSEFKKDFDTVCNSTIIRRLQDKAQVFPLEKDDYARTRLTHSIEVMSIAESLGLHSIITIKNYGDKYLGDNLSKAERKVLKRRIQDIPTILKTASLLHDIGNPPFGHLGERIIGDWFEHNLGKLVFNKDSLLVYSDSAEPEKTLRYLFKGRFADDLKHFDGNAQLFRHVTKLNIVVDDHGMNLSFPVMATFMKYPTASDEISKNNLIRKKPGFFYSEQNLFDEMNAGLKLDKNRYPLSYLLEAADDIAYLTADIEDAYHKGLISLNELLDYFKRDKDDDCIRRVIENVGIYKEKSKEIGYIEETEDYVIRRLRIYIKGLMLEAVSKAFDAAYPMIMDGQYRKELLFESEAGCIASLLKEIEKERIYYCKSILTNKLKAYSIISKLLETFIPAIVNWKEDIDSGNDSANNLLFMSISKNYRYICRRENDKIRQKGILSKDDNIRIIFNKILCATDEISGMTDSHALAVYKRIVPD